MCYKNVGEVSKFAPAPFPPRNFYLFYLWTTNADPPTPFKEESGSSYLTRLKRGCDDSEWPEGAAGSTQSKVLLHSLKLG